MEDLPPPPSPSRVRRAAQKIEHFFKRAEKRPRSTTPTPNILPSAGAATPRANTPVWEAPVALWSPGTGGHGHRIEDPIAAYRLAKAQANMRFDTDWGSLGGGMNGQLKPRYTRLTMWQRRVFWDLVDALHIYVEKFVPGGVDGFDDVSSVYVWNWPTWANFFVAVAGRVTEGPRSNGAHWYRDCWLVGAGPWENGDSSSYSKHKLVPGRFEWRPYSAPNTKNIYAFYVDPEGKAIETFTHRILCVLFNGPPESDRQQASHLCYHSPPHCIRHVIWETDVANKSRRKDSWSCAAYCPHHVKCVYTDTHGRFLTCRNLPSVRKCGCNEGEDCHKAWISADQESMYMQSQ